MLDYQGLQFEEILNKIADYTSFSKGRQAVLNRRPVFSELKINLECERTREALECTIRYGSMPFYGIRDIENALRISLKDGVLSGRDLVDVADHERGLTQVQSYMRKVECEASGLRELTSALHTYPAVAQKIESCISPYGEVLDNASTKLAGIRRRLRSIDGELMSTANKFIAANSSRLMDSIVATRNDRIVVLAKISEKNSLGGLIHGESASGQTAYVEPACLLPLNNEKQTLISQEQEEVERILFECSQCVKEAALHYLDNLETLALLDEIFAKARFGKENDGMIASLSKERELYFKAARHPFIEPDQVVANTYTLKEPIRMLLVTGPNTGGKTVSLKLIGLFVLMTYSGIPVLAEEAIVPYFDEVYLDITDDQSIQESLSTFSAHLRKLAIISDQATSKSLVLLDEIGSGTDPKEGESLAIAVLNDLRQKGCMTIATTHFGRLKTYGKRHKDILVASVQFDMETMMPTFRYIEGLTGQSNALSIARRFGLKESILKEAEFLKSQSKSSEDELIEKLENQIMTVQKEKSELEQRLQEVRLLEGQLRREKDALAMQKENLMDKARLEAEKYVANIQAEAEEYFEEIKQQAKEIKPHEMNQFRKKIGALVQEEEEEENKQRPFQVGDAVSIKNSMQIGKILSASGGRFIIEVNGMKITAKEDQLRHRNAPAEKKTVKNRTIQHSKPRVSMECNLIGMRVEEALPVYEKYMDDALLSGLGSVRIIHGVGTGALRKAVWDQLKKRRDVEYRIGGQGEGGAGATVVTFVSRK